MALACTVLSVHDGDTVQANCGGTRKTVRLAGIDAPELKEQYGKEARDALAAMVLHQQVQIRRIKRDRYRRDVSLIVVNGRDVSAAMVEGGNARGYDKYSIKSLYPLQADAKSARRGLWAHENPVPTWL